MSRALLKTNTSAFTNLVQNWAKQNSFIATNSKNPASTINVISKRFHIFWQINGIENALDVKMTVRPRAWLSRLLNLALFGALLFVICSLKELIKDYTGIHIWNFFISVSLFISILWFRNHYLWLKLTQLEKDFWQQIQNTVDTEILSRPNGQLESPKSRFMTETLFACSVVYICSAFAGLYGFIISGILCTFFITLIWTHLLKDTDLRWHWHFWIIGNMSRWIYVNITILAFAVALISIEILFPLRPYESKNSLSIPDLLSQGVFRTTAPKTALVLETEARNYIYDLSRSQTHEDISFQFSLYFDCIFLLVIFCMGLLFFSVIPIHGILKSKKTWQNQTAELNQPPLPRIPYLTHSWQQEIPLHLILLISFHALIGGILNIVAWIFCMESIAYTLFGKCPISPAIANLWSWVFAPCKILFGDFYGQIIASLFVIILCLPQIILLIVYIRRFINHLSRMFMALLANSHHPLHPFIDQTCARFKITSPLLIIVNHKTVSLSVHDYPFIRRPVILISQETLALLNSEELKAALAHELAHLKQGLWRITVLKLLSSLALFPNHYLTLCVNWAKNEIEADLFALQVTNSPKALKQALIKISTAQKTPTKQNLLIKLFTDRVSSVYFTLQYFFGDNLFGYVHPFLSERLEAIDTYTQQGKSHV